MTSTVSSTSPAPEQEVAKHPVRGVLWGLLLGLGIAIYMVLFAVIPFGDWLPLLLCVLAGVAIGVAWAYFAPPKKPKGPPPAAETESEADDSTPSSIETPRDVLGDAGDSAFPGDGPAGEGDGAVPEDGPGDGHDAGAPEGDD